MTGHCPCSPTQSSGTSAALLPTQTNLSDEEKAVWIACDEKEGTLYIALFNLGDREASVCASLDEIGKEFHGDVDLTDLWDGTSRRSVNQEISAVLPEHGCAVYQVSM